MILIYSGRSALGANSIAVSSDGNIRAIRGSRGDINWGVANANTLLNSDTSKATNKRVMRTLFAEHEVPMPKLLDNSEIGHAIFQGKTVIGRPDYHMKGRGFWKCRTLEDVRRAYRGTRRKAGATHFMEYIEAPREYRVHIFQGKSLRISEKLHTAFHEYTTIKPTHNVKHVRKAAKQAVEALGLDFGTVDILADNDNCWVLEVNTAAGLGGTMPKIWANAFINWKENNM